VKRTLLLGTAWTASAAAAVGLGFLAVSLVDASASPGTVPLAAPASAPTSEDAVASPSASTAAGTKTTVAGTVSASCTSGTPRVSGAPASGWWIDDSEGADAGQVEFRDGSRTLEVHVTCVDGSPRFAVEGPRADGTPAPTTAAAPRDSGGHGADDPAGDDSAGRTGGGHGSDDSGGDDSGGGHRGGSGGHGSDD
jgi:hypothetical protein